jgi:hypothetical protein
MKLCLRDGHSDRRQYSTREAKKAGFNVVNSVERAQIVALHESQYGHEYPYSKKNKYKGKLILIYSGDILDTINDQDIKSERVLFVMFPIERTSHIPVLEWRRVADLIDKNGTFSWKRHELYPVGLDQLSALSILCQGYLAAHGGKGLENWSNLSDELRACVASPEMQAKVSKLNWWRSVLSSSENWKERLEQEADEMARLRSLSDEFKTVKHFAKAIEEGGEFPELVEPTYQAIRRLLGKNKI